MEKRFFMHLYVILACLALALVFVSLPNQRAGSQGKRTWKAKRDPSSMNFLDL